MKSDNTVLRVVNGVMAGLFAFGAVVQFNDPDPLIWALIYLSAAVLCVWAATRRNLPRGLVLGVGAAALLWGLVWLRGAPLDAYLHMFDDWEMKTAAAEEARETSGLLIIAAWMGVLSCRGWFQARSKNDAG